MDTFDALVADLNFDEPDDVVDVTTLDDLALVDMFAKVRSELLETNQMTADSEELSSVDATDEGRTLHSLRVGLLVEMTRRGLR